MTSSTRMATGRCKTPHWESVLPDAVLLNAVLLETVLLETARS